MKSIKEAINSIFNWKEHPTGVFFIAIPLFLIAMSLMVIQAYLQYKINNDIGYAVIVLIAFIAIPILFYPPYKTYMEINKKKP